MLSLERRLRVCNCSEQTIRNYVRGVKALIDYHHQLPGELEIDQVIDFLNELQVEQERAWRTIKIYVAAFRWFYEHILQAKEFAGLIPNPREKPSLPQIISREELARLFNNCTNKKHRVIFRLPSAITGYWQWTKQRSASPMNRKANCKKTCTLPGEKFIARFLLHVLPKGYTPNGMPMAQDQALWLFCHQGKNKNTATNKGKAGDAKRAKTKIHRKGSAQDH